jgi:hypothetical protein
MTSLRHVDNGTTVVSSKPNDYVLNCESAHNVGEEDELCYVAASSLYTVYPILGHKSPSSKKGGSKENKTHDGETLQQTQSPNRKKLR